MGKDDAIRERTHAAADELAAQIKNAGWDGVKVRVKVDKREKESPGFKYNDWELHGACVRVELGPRDLDAGQCILARRDTGEKLTVTLGEATENAIRLLSEQQTGMLQRALEMREANTQRVDTWAEFEALFSGEGAPGFVVAHWDGTQETEDKISELTKATIRCIPLKPLHPDDDKPGVCVLTGKPSAKRVVFAKAY